MTDQSAEAVLVTGVDGSGKTTAIEEMAATLADARRADAAGRGASIGDLVVASDRPVRDIADEILAWLGWLPPA